MIIFIVIVSLLTLAVVLWIVHPLLRSSVLDKQIASVIAIVLPLGAAVLYALLGPIALSDLSNSDKSEAKQAELTQIQGDDQIKLMVTTLAAKLEANPNNPNGWVMLLRSYKVLGRYEEADAAYASAKKHIGETTELRNAYDEVQAARKRVDKNRSQ